MPDSDSHTLTLDWSEKIKMFEAAFEMYWEELCRHAYRKTQSEDLSKDLVQEVYIVLWDKIDNFKEEDQLLPFMYVVLRNKILKQYQKSDVHLRYAMSVARQNEQMAVSSHNLLLSKELQAIVDEEIQKMPLRMREIYLLKKEDGISIREIAEKFSISEQTVKNQLQNAYSRLKVRLKDYDSPILLAGLVIHYMPIITHR